MYWFIYLCCSLLVCLIIASFNKKYYTEIFFLSFLILITPAQIEIANNEYAPSLFTFFFNLSLEQNMSLRPLRPLVITIPASIVLIFIFKIFKRKFF